MAFQTFQYGTKCLLQLFKTIKPDTKSTSRKYMKKSKVFIITITGSLATVE